jgi:hypothetical protein
MEIARHIEMITRGVEGFVIDRTPADVMAYTLDLVGQTNEDRCIELALDIEQFCHKAAISNFNAIAVFARALSFPAKISRVPSEDQLDRLYVARIDALMCGELTKINTLPQTGDLQVFVISEKCRTVEARARSVLRVLDRAAENIERRITGRVTFH